MQIKTKRRSQPSSVPDPTKRVEDHASLPSIEQTSYKDPSRQTLRSEAYSSDNSQGAGAVRDSDVDMNVDDNVIEPNANLALGDTANQPVYASDLPSRTQIEPGSASSHGVPSVPNILVFGETGTGKSSLINMIAGYDVAGVSNGALGCTFGSSQYSVEINGMPFRLWDTAGLNEGEQGSVPAEQAMKNLMDLVHKLKGGVSLLVYCIRGTRFRDILEVNYDLFSNKICRRSVPTVVVVTGLENEDPMESWWEENAFEFADRDMQFVGHACITTTKGKQMKSGRTMFEEEYGESQKVARKLMMAECMPVPWVMDERVWLKQVTSELAREGVLGGGVAEMRRDVRGSGNSHRQSEAGHHSSHRANSLWTKLIEYLGIFLHGTQVQVGRSYDNY